MGVTAKVLTERRDHIWIITINRPEQMNCVDGETAGLLEQAWKTFRDDDDLYVAILTGAGDTAFCAGAGGLELSCLGDMRIASDNAEFWVACRRWNVPLVDGGTQRLPRIIGMGWAMELIVLGKRIDAREAYRIGLANEVVPRGQALARAIEVAEQICAYPQGAIRTDKEAALRGYGRPLEEGLRIECEVGQTVLGSHDNFEGPAAFAEKRPPKFTQD